MNRVVIRGVMAMTAVLVASNYLVRFAVGDWLTWAAFTYPVAFLVTDCVNRAAGARAASYVVAAGFCIGAPLSFFFVWAAPGAGVVEAARIAAASGLAFALAHAADIYVFHRLRRRAWWMPPVLSSAPASVLDTALFFFIAFAGTGAPWLTLAAGDLAVKALMVLLLLLPYRALARRPAAA